MTEKRRIAISMRIIEAENYRETRDAISHEWSEILESLGFIPIFIPNNLSDVGSFLTGLNIDGLILSGGDNIGETPKRDETENKLIQFSLDSKIPIFGVCRGMQILNQFFGGSTKTGKNPQHVGKHHTVDLTDGKVSTWLNSKSIDVNSFHNNTILKEQTGEKLAPFAICKIDDTVEGFQHESLPIMGVMWHPERELNSSNKTLLKRFFED